MNTTFRSNIDILAMSVFLNKIYIYLWLDAHSVTHIYFSLKPLLILETVQFLKEPELILSAFHNYLRFHCNLNTCYHKNKTNKETITITALSH